MTNTEVTAIMAAIIYAGDGAVFQAAGKGSVEYVVAKAKEILKEAGKDD